MNNNDISAQIKEMVRETSTDLYNEGSITKDRLDHMMKLTAKDNPRIPEPISFKGKEILKLRTKLNLSQQVLASYLGVSKATITKWEGETAKPRLSTCRLLHIIDKHGIGILF